MRIKKKHLRIVLAAGSVLAVLVVALVFVNTSASANGGCTTKCSPPGLYWHCTTKCPLPGWPNCYSVHTFGFGLSGPYDKTKVSCPDYEGGAAPIGPFVQPRAGDDPAMFIRNAQGKLPCGVFDVLQWGHSVALLMDYPACTPPDLTVLCLNENGEWIADNVSGVTVHAATITEPPEAGTVAFQVAQHGTCGIFSTK
jgi:hypothetical protein